MKLIKRWSTALTSRVDWMVTQVENQEALVDSAIRDAQKAAARAKVQLGRVRSDGQKLKARHDEEMQAASKWKDRARQCADKDEQKAMECLRRNKRSIALTAQLQARLQEHQRVEQQLTKDVQTIQDSLSGLMEKRNLMRSRQSRAEAVSSISAVTAPIQNDLEDIFERWETRITETEIAGDCNLQGDILEDSFSSTEEDEDLRAELEELKQGN